MIRASLRGLMLALIAGAALFAACGPTPTPKCQASNCSGCCQDDNTCLGGTKQNFSACGSGGAKCRTCLPQQICSGLRCVAGEGGGSGGAGGGGDGGGSGGGVGGGAAGGGSGGGGAAPCGASGQTCCVGMGTGCLLGLTCTNNVCGSGGLGGGAGGGVGGGAGGGGGGVGGGGVGGGGGGGAALGALGDPCVVGANCASNFCQAVGFQDGYCTNACVSNADCATGVCGRNPSGAGNVCLKSCPTAGLAPGGCRTGYVCEKFQSSMNGTPVCFPACPNANVCAGGALTCDSRGFCCGPNGSACCNNATCDLGGTCDPVTKHCKVLPATNRPPGEACTVNTNCSGNICFNEINNAPPACPSTAPCFANGYCTQDCTAAACPAGSSCSDFTFAGLKRCVSNCAWDGGQGDCRSGYICDRYTVAASAQSTCYKKCSHDAGCSTTTACDPTNGFCCGKQFYRCCSGAVKCPGGGTCGANDYCQ